MHIPPDCPAIQQAGQPIAGPDLELAGFAQLLRGGKYTGSLKYDDVTRQARAGLGEDPFGYRAEFLELVRKVKEARGM